MALKAVLFDFNGVIINDEPTHEKLIEQLLLEENLRLQPGEFKQYALGRSDRVCLQELFTLKDRTVTDSYLDSLVARKAQAYLKLLTTLETMPIYPGLEDAIFQIKSFDCKLALVSGATRSEIELVLERTGLRSEFSVIVAGDEILTSKPAPDGYLLAVDLLNQAFPDLTLLPEECLIIEDSFAGIQAAKAAKIPVVGVANTYPYHMIQRISNWAVDYLSDLEWERIRSHYEKKLINY